MTEIQKKKQVTEIKIYANYRSPGYGLCQSKCTYVQRWFSPSLKNFVLSSFQVGIRSARREGLKKTANHPHFVDKGLTPLPYPHCPKLIIFTLRNFLSTFADPTPPLPLIHK